MGRGGAVEVPPQLDHLVTMGSTNARPQWLPEVAQRNCPALFLGEPCIESAGSIVIGSIESNPEVACNLNFTLFGVG